MARVTRQVQALYALCAAAIVEGRADLDGADEVGFDIELPVFSVGRAAELAGIHSQTLRQYDRQGLVVPQRTEGGARRYSLRDVSRLAEAHHLSQDEGISLVGIVRILDLEEENRQLRREVHRLNRPSGSSVFAANAEGDIIEMQRSQQARRWRRDIHARVRELPYRPHDVDADSAASIGHGVTGEEAVGRRQSGTRDSGSLASFTSGRAMVVYGERFD
jgi:MerR family transcriptional regulator, heat shock protein HspR